MHISSPHSVPGNEAAREAFVRFYSENKFKGSPLILDVDIEESDPRLPKLLELLASHGMRPVPEELKRKELSDEEWQRYFRWRKYRTYDPSDCMACEYVRMRVTQAVSGMDRRPDNKQFEMWRSKPTAWMLKAGIASAEISYEEIVVSSEVRAALEAGQFAHLRFNNIIHNPVWKASLWWELDSDLMLPQVSPTTLLIDDRGEPIKHGDIARPFIGMEPRDGINPPLYTYRRSDLESVGPFDIARAYEPYGNRLPQRNALIVSQRFFRKCLQLKLDCMWVPVRIEE